MSEIRGPQTVGRREDELWNAMRAAGFGDVACAVDVGGPQIVIVDRVMGQQSGTVLDRTEAPFGKDGVEQ